MARLLFRECLLLGKLAVGDQLSLREKLRKRVPKRLGDLGRYFNRRSALSSFKKAYRRSMHQRGVGELLDCQALIKPKDTEESEKCSN